MANAGPLRLFLPFPSVHALDRWLLIVRGLVGMNSVSKTTPSQLMGNMARRLSRADKVRLVVFVWPSLFKSFMPSSLLRKSSNTPPMASSRLNHPRGGTAPRPLHRRRPSMLRAPTLVRLP